MEVLDVGDPHQPLVAKTNGCGICQCNSSTFQSVMMQRSSRGASDTKREIACIMKQA